ncbi:SMC5-SMC6 complex localization factor protein 2-like [Heptranchias perlo]|uniref:SMC5-SMC6 complex localization factor protein 2-like n=1 Tax=Heptranchias perlo TaxID=212740 RepID=UPI00355A433C
MKQRKPLTFGKGNQAITQFFKPRPDTGNDRLILGSPRRGGTDDTSELQRAEPFQKHVTKTPSFKSKRPMHLPSSTQRSPVLEAFMKGVLKSERKESMGGVVKCQVTQNPGSPRVVVRRLFLPSSQCPSEGTAVVKDQGKNVKQCSNSEVAAATQEDTSSKCNTDDYRSNTLWRRSLPDQRITSPPTPLDVLKYSNGTNSSDSVHWYMRPRLSPRRLQQHGSFNNDFLNTLQAYKRARELRKLRLQKRKHSSYSSANPFSGGTINQGNLKRTYSLPSTSLTGSATLSKRKESVLTLVTKTLPSGSLAEENNLCSKEAVQRHRSYPPCCDRKNSLSALINFPAGLSVSCSKDKMIKKRKRDSLNQEIRKKKRLDATFHKNCESKIADKYSTGVTEINCNGVLKDHNNGVLENEDTALEADEFPDSDSCLPFDSLLDEEISRHTPPNSYSRLPTEEKAKTALDSAISSKENRSGLLGRQSLVTFDSKRTQRLESGSLTVLPLDEDSRPSLPSQEMRQLERFSTAQLPDSNKGPERKQRDSYSGLDSDDDVCCNLDSDEEDETLMALDDLLTLRNKPVSGTPEKSGISFQLSAPNTPTAWMTFKSRQTNYSNSFERLLKEKKQSESLGKTLKDLKKKLQDELNEAHDISSLTEEDDEQSMDEDMDQIAEEHRAFLLRFSVKSDGIPDLHPGENIFNLLQAGKLFNEQNLRLTKCELTPQNFLERTLVSSGISQQVFLFTNGIVSQTYYSSPCPQPVFKFLFKMMTIHSDYIASMHIFKALWDICTNAANRIVKGGASEFKVWTPSLQDVVTVFLNLGAQIGTLFPLKHLQPDFTEEDILSGLQNNEENYPKDSVPASQREPIFSSLPEFGIKNVVKFLLLCTSICPEAYSDKELVLLISLLGRISLEQELQLTLLKDFQCLLDNLLNNVRQWDTKMFDLCMILSDLSEHHHNLLYLVQLLPDFSTRGRQLRRHLSLVIISKLLDKGCMYVPKDPDLKISHLCRFLYLMKPSSLLKTIEETSKSEQQGQRKEAALTELDQQAYYLCYNLLVLANEVVHIEHIPSSQRNHLIQLCAGIEKYIKCDIREDPKLLYRSKVKDLEARTHAKWQELLQRSRPLQGKLHDYWKPMPEDLNHLSQSSVFEEEAEHYMVHKVHDRDKDLDIV